MSGCVLDTDMVIAALDRRDAHHDQAATAITAMIDDDVALAISLINYAEALVRPAEDEGTLRAAVKAIATLGIQPIAPTSAIARDAARHRSLSISLADGFAIATAQARASTVATFDRRVRRIMTDLAIESPASLA